jgi:hypothetical protein
MSTHPPEPVAPTRADPVAAAASEVIGGPLGRYAALARHTARSGRQPAAAVLVALSSLTVALGVLQKAHCLSKGWNTPDQFWHVCYSDLPAVYQTSGLGHAMPYLHGAKPLDQPVVSGLVMWLVGLAVPDGSVLAQQQWYFALWAVLVTVIVMTLVAVTAASVPRTPWRAAHVALSPVLVLASLVSVDLLGVLLTSVALWAWGRSRVALAGVVLGLAISARTYPLVVLVAIGLLAVRCDRLGAWRRLAGTALATWFAVSLPWLVVNAGNLLSVYRTWWRSGAGYGSLWLVPQLMGHPLTVGVVTTLTILGAVAAVVVGALFALSLDRRPTVAELSLVMLVIVVVTSKAVPVQAGLWLLPLIALAGMQWRDHLVWAGFEATYFVAVWLYIADQSTPDRGLPPGAYTLVLGLRLAAMVFLLVQVWRMARARRPVHQPVDWPDLVGAGAGDGSGPVGSAREGSGLVGAGSVVAGSVGSAPVDGEPVEAEAWDEVDPLAGPMAGARDQVLVRFG